MIKDLLDKIRVWAGPFIDKLNLNPKYILPMWQIQIGFKVNPDDMSGKAITFWRDWGWRISGCDAETHGLYRNAMFSSRFMLPFYLNLMIRWAGKDPTKKEYFQMSLPGWKTNGQFTPGAFRFQSDESAAHGTTSPNYGQAIGWNDGTK